MDPHSESRRYNEFIQNCKTIINKMNLLKIFSELPDDFITLQAPESNKELDEIARSLLEFKLKTFKDELDPDEEYKKINPESKFSFPKTNSELSKILATKEAGISNYDWSADSYTYNKSLTKINKNVIHNFDEKIIESKPVPSNNSLLHENNETVEINKTASPHELDSSDVRIENDKNDLDNNFEKNQLSHAESENNKLAGVFSKTNAFSPENYTSEETETTNIQNNENLDLEITSSISDSGSENIYFNNGWNKASVLFNATPTVSQEKKINTAKDDNNTEVVMIPQNNKIIETSENIVGNKSKTEEFEDLLPGNQESNNILQRSKSSLTKLSNELQQNLDLNSTKTLNDTADCNNIESSSICEIQMKENDIRNSEIQVISSKNCIYEDNLINNEKEIDENSEIQRNVLSSAQMQTKMIPPEKDNQNGSITSELKQTEDKIMTTEKEEKNSDTENRTVTQKSKLSLSQNNNSKRNATSVQNSWNEDSLPYTASFMSLALTANELEEIDSKVNKVCENQRQTKKEKYKVLKSVFFKEKVANLNIDNTCICFAPVCWTRNLNSYRKKSNASTIKPKKNYKFGENNFIAMRAKITPQNDEEDDEEYDEESDTDEEDEGKDIGVNTDNIKYRNIKKGNYGRNPNQPYRPSVDSLPFELVDKKQTIRKQPKKFGKNKYDFPYEPSINSLPLSNENSKNCKCSDSSLGNRKIAQIKSSSPKSQADENDAASNVIYLNIYNSSKEESELNECKGVPGSYKCENPKKDDPITDILLKLCSQDNLINACTTSTKEFVVHDEENCAKYIIREEVENNSEDNTRYVVCNENQFINNLPPTYAMNNQENCQYVICADDTNNFNPVQYLICDESMNTNEYQYLIYDNPDIFDPSNQYIIYEEESFTQEIDNETNLKSSENATKNIKETKPVEQKKPEPVEEKKPEPVEEKKPEPVKEKENNILNENANNPYLNQNSMMSQFNPYYNGMMPYNPMFMQQNQPGNQQGPKGPCGISPCDPNVCNESLSEDIISTELVEYILPEEDRMAGKTGCQKCCIFCCGCCASKRSIEEEQEHEPLQRNVGLTVKSKLCDDTEAVNCGTPNCPNKTKHCLSEYGCKKGENKQIDPQQYFYGMNMFPPQPMMMPPYGGNMMQPPYGMMPQPFPGMLQQPFPGMLQQPNPGMLQQPNPGMLQQPNPGMLQQHLGMLQQPNPGMLQQPNPGMLQQPNPGMLQQPYPGMLQQPSPFGYETMNNGSCFPKSNYCKPIAKNTCMIQTPNTFMPSTSYGAPLSGCGVAQTSTGCGQPQSMCGGPQSSCGMQQPTCGMKDMNFPPYVPPRFCVKTPILEDEVECPKKNADKIPSCVKHFGKVECPVKGEICTEDAIYVERVTYREI